MCFYNRHRHPLEISAHCRQQTVRASVLPTYSDTPEMFSFTLAGHAVGNSPRPSACPNTDMELVMGASVLGIGKGPPRSAAQTPQFLQRIPEVFPPAKIFKPLRCVAGLDCPRQTLLDSRPGCRGLGFLCSAPCWAAVVWFGKSALVVPRDGVCDAWLTCALCMHTRNRICILLSYTPYLGK